MSIMSIPLTRDDFMCPYCTRPFGDEPVSGCSTSNKHLCLECCTNMYLRAIQRGKSVDNIECPYCKLKFEPILVSGINWRSTQENVAKFFPAPAGSNTSCEDTDNSLDGPDDTMKQYRLLFEEHICWAKENGFKLYKDVEPNKLSRLQFRMALWDFAGLCHISIPGNGICVHGCEYLKQMEIRRLRKACRFPEERWGHIGGFLLNATTRNAL